MEAVRTLKTNLKLQDKPCGWCHAGLQLGEDAAVCTTCEKEHHQRCWDGKAGCATEGCANAPLRRLDPVSPYAPGAPGAPGAPYTPYAASTPYAAVPPPASYGPGMMGCPQCRSAIPAGSPFCSFCRAVTSPDGIYHGPRMNAPGATASLVFGILGLFFCGIIFGPLAISKANEAKRAMNENPIYTGAGLATAGSVLGIIDLVLWAIFLLVRIGGMS